MSIPANPNQPTPTPQVQLPPTLPENTTNGTVPEPRVSSGNLDGNPSNPVNVTSDPLTSSSTNPGILVETPIEAPNGPVDLDRMQLVQKILAGEKLTYAQIEGFSNSIAGVPNITLESVAEDGSLQLNLGSDIRLAMGVEADTAQITIRPEDGIEIKLELQQDGTLAIKPEIAQAMLDSAMEAVAVAIGDAIQQAREDAETGNIGGASSQADQASAQANAIQAAINGEVDKLLAHVTLDLSDEVMSKIKNEAVSRISSLVDNEEITKDSIKEALTQAINSALPPDQPTSVPASAVLENMMVGQFDKALVDFFMVLQLFQKMGIASRQTARQGRAAAQVGVVQNILNQAEKQLQSAVTSGVTRIMTGALKAVSGFISIGGGAKALAADKAALTNAGGNQPHFIGQMISQQYQGSASFVDAIGEVTGATGGVMSGAMDAEATELRAREEQYRALKANNEQWMGTQEELSKKVLEVMAQMISQQVSANQRIAGNI